MKASVLIVRSALALAAVGSLGSAVASEGIARYYSLQASAKAYSGAGDATRAPVVVVRYKDAGTASAASSAVAKSAGSSLSSSVVTGYTAASDNATFNKADSHEALALSDASKATSVSTTGTKTNSGTSSGTSSSTWGFTNSGNYSIVTSNGGVALNNVYVGGDLNITINVTGGTWNTSPTGGHGGGVSNC